MIVIYGLTYGFNFMKGTFVILFLNYLFRKKSDSNFRIDNVLLVLINRDIIFKLLFPMHR